MLRTDLAVALKHGRPRLQLLLGKVRLDKGDLEVRLAGVELGHVDRGRVGDQLKVLGLELFRVVLLQAQRDVGQARDLLLLVNVLLAGERAKELAKEGNAKVRAQEAFARLVLIKNKTNK